MLGQFRIPSGTAHFLLEKYVKNDIIIIQNNYIFLMHQIQLEQFEGPLDLLLQLIEKDKLQITEISLAKVTDQYLNYLDDTDMLASTEVADFLLIASKLIYLKSKYLLPDFNMEDEDDAGSLEKQLKIYRQYYDVSKKINKMFNQPTLAYQRAKPYKLPDQKKFVEPKNVDKDILRSLFEQVLQRIETVVNIPKVVMAKAVSIGERIKDIKDKIKNSDKFSFKNILRNKKDKMEAIVSFLAALELVKQREIVISQDQMFGDMNILKNNKDINY